jgi:hypothetical protein
MIYTIRSSRFLYIYYTSKFYISQTTFKKWRTPTNKINRHKREMEGRTGVKRGGRIPAGGWVIRPVAGCRPSGSAWWMDARQQWRAWWWRRADLQRLQQYTSGKGASGCGDSISRHHQNPSLTTASWLGCLFGSGGREGSGGEKEKGTGQFTC